MRRKDKDWIERSAGAVPDFKRLDSNKNNGAEAVHYDKGKARMDLIPPEALISLGEVLGHACEEDPSTNKPNKYEERNWEKGMPWHKVYGSLQRHLTAFWSGEDIDPESGEPHIELALANLTFLVTYTRRGTGTDTRPTTKGLY